MKTLRTKLAGGVSLALLLTAGLPWPSSRL